MRNERDWLDNYRERYEPLQRQPHDGIKDLPNKPGIYCILNRVTGKRYVGQSQTSMRRRALTHRSEMKSGRPMSLLMVQDLKTHGYESFVFFSLFWFDEEAAGRSARLSVLNTELYWGIQLGAHLEETGYNLSLGRFRTAGSRFRDQERKLLRRSSINYQQLPGVQMYDPINSAMLATWVPGR